MLLIELLNLVENVLSISEMMLIFQPVSYTHLFPVMSDFYDLCEEEYMTYDRTRKYLYTEEVLQADTECVQFHRHNTKKRTGKEAF